MAKLDTSEKTLAAAEAALASARDLATKAAAQADAEVSSFSEQAAYWAAQAAEARNRGNAAAALVI